MRLVVKQNERTINEFRFNKGPIYIGRHTNSQVFLPGRAVSRQHAVIFKTYEGKWILEDLDSANKIPLFLDFRVQHEMKVRCVHIAIGDHSPSFKLCKACGDGGFACPPLAADDDDLVRAVPTMFRRSGALFLPSRTEDRLNEIPPDRTIPGSSSLHPLQKAFKVLPVLGEFLHDEVPFAPIFAYALIFGKKSDIKGYNVNPYVVDQTWNVQEWHWV